jgi:ABC-type branched-subunit amino acid transport system ATPase component
MRCRNRPRATVLPSASRRGRCAAGPRAFSALTARENLQVGTQGNRSRAFEMLEKVVTYFPVRRARFQQKAGTMSGGEQQQLPIARTLIGEPKI